MSTVLTNLCRYFEIMLSFTIVVNLTTNTLNLARKKASKCDKRIAPNNSTGKST